MSRIWRTADGRHVADGHPDAVFLAYGVDDQVPADVLAEVEGKPHRKARRKPADKQAPKPDDKSGLTINRPGDAADS